MSNWMIEKNRKKFSCSHGDMPYSLEEEKTNTDQIQIKIKWYEGKYDETPTSASAYLSGRNLEVFKEWLNEHQED